jgi:5-methylcytosine-specific restriction endonuclease McrA
MRKFNDDGTIMTKEQRREYSRKTNARFRLAHPGYFKEKSFTFYLIYPERRKKKYIKFNFAHPGYFKKATAKYRLAHPECNSKWQKANPEKVKAASHRHRTRKTGAGGSYTITEWKALVKAAGYRCLCCTRRRPLTADHVIPVSKGGSSNIDNIQVLCQPCNSSKGTKTTDFRKENPCPENVSQQSRDRS